MSNEHMRERAKELYKEAYNRTTSSDVLEVLKEARSFIDRHSESWYYTGQELLGKMDAIIAQEELK